MTMLYLNIVDGQFTVGYIGQEVAQADVISLKSADSPAIVCQLAKNQEYLKKERNYIHITQDGQDYDFLIGIEISGGVTHRYHTLVDFAKGEQFGKAAFKALVQYNLAQLGMNRPIDEVKFGEIIFLRHETAYGSASGILQNEAAEREFISKVLEYDYFTLKPAERALSRCLKGEDENVLNDLNDTDCTTFIKITQNALILYTTDGNGDLMTDSLTITDQISISSLFEGLRDAIREKTGFTNMPLGDKLLIKALANGHIGSSQGGMYADLRREVNDLLDRLVEDIVNAIYTYASSGNVFGEWYFSGFLSEALHEKLSIAVAEKFSRGEEVKCSISHLPDVKKLLFDNLATQLGTFSVSDETSATENAPQDETATDPKSNTED